MPKPAPLGFDIGSILKERREELGLSMREAARRIGISPSYLLAVECGRNPSTGRPPTPSPQVLRAAANVLAVPLRHLLGETPSAPPGSAHVLVYQTGGRHRSALPAAKRLFGDAVDLWVEVVDPRRGEGSEQSPDVLAIRGPYGLGARRAGSFNASEPIDAVCRVLRDADASRKRVGIIFGATSAILRVLPDLTTLLDSEKTWDQEVSQAVSDVVGSAPVANVCVYRQADIEEAGSRIDPLATLLSLVESHRHVVAQGRGDEIVTGPVAIERGLVAARPPGVSSDTWRVISKAAAVGLRYASEEQNW
jgi:transcriptional regulator with XRE-family HTH domain